MCGSHRPTRARTPEELAELRLRDWDPQPMLHAHTTEVPTPLVPVVDAHNHLGRWLHHEGGWMAPDVGALLALMDARGVAHIVNLDGRWGAELEENLDRYDRAHPQHFSTFCHLDWSVLAESHVGAVSAPVRTTATARLITSLQASAAAGARGLKVWKDLGLHVRDADDRLVLPDDARLAPVWEAAGELGLPITIHTADPVAFFAPLDERNERLDELGRMPQWWFGDTSRFPTFARLFAALEGAVAAAPRTRFVGAHVGCLAEDLDAVGTLLQRYPNLSVDLGGRLGEIGRQPRRFRRFVLDHPRQVLFGTDAFPLRDADYPLHYRFLETADEHFAYWSEPGIAPQGRWHVSGVHLPHDALRRVYASNAREVLGITTGTRRR